MEPTIETSESKPKLLSEIKPIEQGGVLIQTREKIKEVVENPLLSACEELYDKNIKTVASSANQKDIAAGNANILIDFKTLSPENQMIAQGIGEVIDSPHWGGQVVNILIPIHKDMTSVDLQQQAEQVAHRFKSQSLTWAPKYTKEKIGKIYGNPDWEKLTPTEIEEMGYFYAEDEDVYYASREHYKKAKEYKEKYG